MPKSIGLPRDVQKLSEDSSIIILEGFEMTGKTILRCLIENHLSTVMSYRPSWEDELRDSIINRGNRFIPGLAVLDFLNQNSYLLEDKVLLVERMLMVTLVYNNFYPEASANCDCLNDSCMADSFIKFFDQIKARTGKEVRFFHKCHASYGDAALLYSASGNDGDHNDIYDKFSSFDEYYGAYNKFEETYRNIYESYGFAVTYLDKNNEVLIL